MAFWAKIPFTFFLLLLTSTFLSLPVPAQSLRLIIPSTSSVNTPTTVVWAPEPSDGLGQDNSLPPSDETSYFDLRFVNADTQEDEGLASANVDFRIALAKEGGREINEVVFNKPGRFFLRAVSGPTFRTIGVSNVVSVAAASTIKLQPTPTSSGAPGASSPTSTTSSPSTSRATNKTPIIVGALIGALVFITLLTLLLLFLLRRRRIQREEEEAISRLSFHPDQMVIPKTAASGGGVRRQSLAARIWGSFSGAASAASVNPTANSHQAASAEGRDRDLEGGLGFGPTTVKEEEARRPSDTTTLSNYSSSSQSTLSTTDTDPHAQIHAHSGPSAFTRPDDRELYRVDLEAARATSEQQSQRDLEAARESVNSVEDLRSPRVLDRSSTSSTSSSSGLGGTNGTGSSALLGVIAFRNPFLDYGRDEEEGSRSKTPEMAEVNKKQASILIPPAPQTPPPPVPTPSRTPSVPSRTPSVRVLPPLPPPTPTPPPVLASPVPVPPQQSQRTVRIAELEAGRVGSESPRLPPVRISQAGLGLVFSMASPTAPSTTGASSVVTSKVPAATTTTTITATAKKSAPPPPPPRKSKPTQPKASTTTAATTTQSRPSAPTTSTRARALPTPTFPPSLYSPVPTKPLPSPVPSRPTTPNTARPLPTPGLAINIPLPRTPSPPTPGVNGGFGIRALPPVPPSANEGVLGLKSAPIAPPTSAFTARIDTPNTNNNAGAATATSGSANRTKRQRHLDLRLSQAQSQLSSLKTKLRRGEIEEGVARRVIRDLEKQVEWLEGSGIREGGWARGERDWMEESEEAGWRRWMRP